MSDLMLVRRGIPSRVTVDGVRWALGINDMDDAAGTATLGVHGPDGSTRHVLSEGSHVDIGGRGWTVLSVLVGDRGRIRLEADA